MHAKIIKAIGPAPTGRPSKFLTESEKLAIYAAAGNPIDIGQRWEAGVLKIVISSRWKFDVRDDGGYYIVAIKNER